MKNCGYLFFVLVVIGLSGFSLHAQKPPPKIVAEKKEFIDPQDFLGTVNGQEYQNVYFRLKLTAPESWIIQESAIGEVIKQRGKEVVEGKTATIQKSIEDSLDQVHVLLTITEHIIGIEKNAALVLAVEKINSQVQVRNGRDYLELVIQTYKKMNLPADMMYSEEIKSETFGAETFYYIEIRRAGFEQRIYASYRRGYALFYTLNYFDTDQLNSLREAMMKADYGWSIK
jgi:hypothetical protein